MPGYDGTGPRGMGAMTGGGRGGRLGSGSGGNCLCPGCSLSVPHKAGVPCNSVKCPKCGTKMVRE